jgi:murein DD-endopeptidase MepM/ murein hydrolase activator NlpD
LTGKKYHSGTVKRSSHTRRSFLKRTFTQKVKQVPSCAADSFDALSKLYFVEKPAVSAAIPTEVNRRSRRSAAMIGLAISMTAAGLALPQQGDEAMAVEPIATEPNLPTHSVDPSTTVSPASAKEPGVVTNTAAQPQVQQKAAIDVAPTTPPVVEHKVNEGETLWKLSKTYEVQPEAISSSNKINPSAALPVGQNLKIPSVNGIVHEVKAGETVESLSKSYGVEPTQLKASASVSELSQLQTGESVTVPGNVNKLLKARQDVALDNLKEKRNRLSDSLAELRSEESSNQSERATVPTKRDEAAESVTPVTLPSAVVQPKEEVANAPHPLLSVPTNQVVIPVPTPEIAATPTGIPKTAKQPESSVVIPAPTPEIAATPTGVPKTAKQPESSVVIPVPTPEIAATPTVVPKTAKQPESSVVLPVPTPEIAATPTVVPKTAKQPESSVVLPVPTPEIAATPTVVPKTATEANPVTAPITTPATAVKPQVPQPVVMQTLVSGSSANVYQVKPGDTLEAIARRYNLSSSDVIWANGLNNPNLLRVNQQLRIPQAQTASINAQTVTLLPGINKSSSSPSGQDARGVAAPTLAVPTGSDKITPVVPTAPQSQAQSVPRAVLAQSSVVSSAKPNSSVVVDTQPSQSADSQQNPYIEKLRADILRLRAEYRQPKDTTQASGAINIPVPTVTTPVAASLNNTSTPIRINPEFKPDQYNATLQAGIEKRPQQQQRVQQGPIKIEVPPPVTGPSASQRDLIATAPAPADSYNPSLRTPVGQTVSPELPSLSAPDMYLPGSRTQFNGYIWPTKGVLTSGYGPRWGRMHKGIDIAAPIGTPIVAAAPGVVVSAGWHSGGYGNLVEIQHPDGSVTLYAHNNRILVRRGQEVAQGQQISEMGSTGRSTGPHCHFEVHPPGRGAVNPIALLPSSR